MLTRWWSTFFVVLDSDFGGGGGGDAGGDGGGDAGGDAAGAGAVALAPDAGGMVSDAPDGDLDLDGELHPQATMFGRSYVEKLRQEAARYRTQTRELETQFQEHQPWVETLTGYESPEDRQAVIELARAIREEPEVATAWMEEYVKAIREQNLPPEPGSPNDPNRPVTMADLQRWQQEQAVEEQRAEQERQATEFRQATDSKLTELGYDPAADWTAEGWRSKVDQIGIVGLAAHLTGGDFDKAHEMWADFRRQAIVDWVADRRRDAGGVPALGGGGGAPARPVVEATEPGRDPWAKVNQAVAARAMAEFGTGR